MRVRRIAEDWYVCSPPLWMNICSYPIAALNFPANRGTATAIALSAFGLSAFFFSTLSSLLFPGNSAEFLFLLSTLTSGICIVGYFFCRVVPVSSYAVLPDSESSNRLHRTRSGDSTKSTSHLFAAPEEEPGTPNSPRSYTFASPSSSSSSAAAGHPSVRMVPNVDDDVTENSSLFTKSSSESDEDERRRDLEAAAHRRNHSDDDHADHHRADISGWGLITSSDFWILFGIMAALAGVGLMTINNIGQDVSFSTLRFRSIHSMLTVDSGTLPARYPANPATRRHQSTTPIPPSLAHLSLLLRLPHRLGVRLRPPHPSPPPPPLLPSRFFHPRHSRHNFGPIYLRPRIPPCPFDLHRSIIWRAVRRRSHHRLGNFWGQ